MESLWRVHNPEARSARHHHPTTGWLRLATGEHLKDAQQEPASRGYGGRPHAYVKRIEEAWRRDVEASCVYSRRSIILRLLLASAAVLSIASTG